MNYALSILFVLLAVLKLLGLISIGWFWVFSPLLFLVALILFVLAFAILATWHAH